MINENPGSESWPPEIKDLLEKAWRVKRAVSNDINRGDPPKMPLEDVRAQLMEIIRVLELIRDNEKKDREVRNAAQDAIEDVQTKINDLGIIWPGESELKH